MSLKFARWRPQAAWLSRESMFFPTPFLEYRSFAALARHVLDDDRTWPTPEEIREIASISGMTPVQVAHQLKQTETWSSETYLMLKLTPPTHRAHEKSVRGFRRGSHDLNTVAPHFNPTRTEGESIGLAEAYSTDEEAK
jgi:hypothetical protein